MQRSEEVLLEAARRGDESAYAELIGPRRGELHAHCYRMLGSVQDAEDALQDALLRAWRGLPRFQARSSVRSWLYRIATNACLDALGRRPARMLPLDHGPASDPHDGPGRPLVESVWIDPYPDERLGARLEDTSPEARYAQRESVELAFVAALQHLPPRGRAVLILREVLGFSAAEVAEELGSTVASVNSALQRARASLDERLPDESQQSVARRLGDAELRAIVDRYVAAWEAGDVDAVVGLLSEDVVITMPPMATWYAGRDAARVFLAEWAFARRWSRERDVFESGVRDVRLVRTSANGQPALAAYNRDPEDGLLKPYALQVLTLRDGRIAQVDGFVTPSHFPAFGLPAVLDAPDEPPDAG
jgi:RNA polymerase sigma-70 factor (ECF subfamily)